MIDENFYRIHLMNRSPATVLTYKRTLIQFEKWLLRNNQTIEMVVRFDIQQYVRYLQAKKIETPTILKFRAAITAYAIYIGRADIVEDINFPKVSPQLTSPLSLTKDERNSLLRNVERDGNMRNMAIIYMLYEFGLRASELVNLDRSDVRLSYRASDSAVHIRNGKGNRDRTIPFPSGSDAKRYLERYLSSRSDKQEALFLSNYNKRISQRSLNYLLNKYGTHPHALRHTLFSNMAVNQKISLSTIAKIAGHSDIKTILRYLQPHNYELSEAMNSATSDRYDESGYRKTRDRHDW